MRLMVNLTYAQICRLAELRARQVGRVDPRKRWTDAERKVLAREWLERISREALL